MVLSLSTLIILTVSVFFCSIMSAMMGMAGGVLFLGILASFVETTYVVPIYAFAMMVSSASRSILFYKHINWQIVFRYILGLLPGALLGIFIFQLLPKDLIKLAMGVFILVMVFLPASRKQNRFDMWVFLPVGFTMFLLGLTNYIYTYLVHSRFTNMSVFLFVTAITIFMMSLISEQICQMRFERRAADRTVLKTKSSEKNDRRS